MRPVASTSSTLLFTKISGKNLLLQRNAQLLNLTWKIASIKSELIQLTKQTRTNKRQMKPLLEIAST